jgi:DNA repair protein RecO (recombination protein O)
VSASRRVQNQPGWLLHHRPFRDSSRIIDVLSRDHGRLSLVARGSLSAKSKLKGILRPFLPLRLSWVIRGDMGTLTGAEMHGAPIALSGESLMSGYYVNELMLSLLHRHDPQPEVYAVYGAAIAGLNGAGDVAATLRRFEMETLGLLGYALTLDHEAATGDALNAEQVYEYRVEQGPVAGGVADGPMSFTGSELQAIARQELTDPATLGNAGRLLRHVIAWHLDGRELQSRKVLREMRRVADQRTC